MAEWKGTLPDSLPEDYSELRKCLIMYVEEAESIRRDINGGGSYASDLYFGLRMYDYLTNSLGMQPCDASDDDIWRYIQIEVVPDFVMSRWAPQDASKRVNNERFWENPRRIWLKTLWWYVHLSLQEGSVEKTGEVLKNNSSDDISQLVERSGGGYRVELYREIMKRYGSTADHNNKLLRKVLKLNVINCSTSEPLLSEDGVNNYVEGLFRYCEE